VRTGESIWRIAKAYRVSLQELAEFNNIFSPNDVKVGMRLYIPKREKRAAFKKLPFDGVSKGGRRRGKRPRRYRYASSKKIQTYRGKFIWPVNGRLSSRFGIRNGRRHDGIDITAKRGTPIKAASSGKIVFSGKMRGYGNLVLIRHKGDFFTAYAHNHRNKVRKGKMVKRGQVIASVGRTGRASGNHLHFEIRRGQTARNPLFFLPERAERKRSKAYARGN